MHYFTHLISDELLHALCIALHSRCLRGCRLSVEFTVGCFSSRISYAAFGCEGTLAVHLHLVVCQDSASSNSQQKGRPKNNSLARWVPTTHLSSNVYFVAIIFMVPNVRMSPHANLHCAHMLFPLSVKSIASQQCRRLTKSSFIIFLFGVIAVY